MRCARPECVRTAGLAVDMGAGLHVVLCLDDGIRALARSAGRRARALPGLIKADETLRLSVTARSRAATSGQLPHPEDIR